MNNVDKRLESLSPRKRVLFEWLLKEKAKQENQASHAKHIATNYDVAILGGGLAGLTLARQIKRSRPETTIFVAEKNKYPVPEAAFKVGESTVEMGTNYLADVLGLKEHLDADQLPKAGLRFFFSTDDNRDIAERFEYGVTGLPPIPSYQIDRGRFENMLAAEARKQGVVLYDDCRVQQVSLGNHQHDLVVRRGEDDVHVSARWVVDASGRASLLKRQLGLAKKVGHQANAVWFRIDDEINPHDWSDDPAWQARVTPLIRRLSTNHLMGRGYWVWLIPLASGGTSVGIVADAALHPINTMNNFDRALAWLYKHEPQCARAIDAKQHLLQDFKALKHYSYDCKKVFSEDRWCLTGEAGAFADPFYSPGTDLIGISNGFVTDLITRDLEGEPIEPRVEAYNSLYRSFCRELLVFYEGQYPLMGNAQLMLTKITWDWSIYWGFATLLFFHNKLCDLEFMTRVSHVLHRANDLNACMQKFFRQWDERGRRPKSRKGFVPLTDIDFLYDLHEGLSAGLNDKELAVRLSKNLAVVETAAAEIIRKAEQLVPGAAAEKLAYWSGNGSSGASQIPASEEIAADLDAIWLDAIPVPV